MIVRSTEKLINYFKNEEKLDGMIISSYVNSILKIGSKTDAEALLAYFLLNPINFYSNYLFSVFKKWGDYNFAKKIFDTYIEDDLLIDEENYEILELLGYLKFEEVKASLVHYSFYKKSNYYMNRSAIIGLLNFNCDEYQDIIKKEIENTYGKNLFPEFIPALVCKLKDKSGVLEKLYENGKTYASVDCNAGIILGFSLCKDEGLEYFKSVLYDSHWEADSVATGTGYFTYKGINNLNISLIDFYLEIKKEKNQSKQENALNILVVAIELAIKDYSYSTNSFLELYTKLFSWKSENESDNIVDLAHKFEIQDKVYEIESLLELKLNEEFILLN